MSTSINTLRVGMRRGLIEMRNSLQAPSDLGYYVIGNAVFVVAMLFLRNDMIEELNVSTARLVFPGVLAMITVFVAAYGLATVLSTEREDGTLLRAKSMPHGMRMYVTGQVTRTALEFAFSAVILLIAGTIIIDGLWANGPGAAAAVIGFLVLGLLACIPLGLATGSIFTNPRSVGGWGFLVLAGLIAISGVFSPLAQFPDWLQLLGQLFPLYWIGLGLRSAMMPAESVVIEIAGDWRTVETLLVLGAWAAVGLALAPILLRRMARRESGSAVEARRHALMQKVG